MKRLAKTPEGFLQSLESLVKPLRQFRGRKGPRGIYALLRKSCPFPVEEEDLLSYHLGKTDGRTIWIQRSLPPGEKAVVLLHEWAHCLLHGGYVKAKDLLLAEVEAEAVTYVVGRSLGLEVQECKEFILHNRKNIPSVRWIALASREILRCIGVEEGRR